MIIFKQNTLDLLVKTIIAKNIDLLKGRDRKILELRYGLDGSEPLDIKEVAKRLCMNSERAKNREEVAYFKLYKRLSEEKK